MSRTHTRDIEKYGGLIKFMPLTAVAFLVGAISISGLPPFNGFASEWLSYMTLFNGAGLPGITDKAVFMLASGALALTSGLAIACFVRAFGLIFLARPRSRAAAKARETTAYMTVPMLALAVLCAALGLGAGTVIVPIRATLTHLAVFAAGDASGLAAGAGGTVHIGSGAYFNQPLTALYIIAALLIGAALVFLTSRKQRTRRAPLWANGYQHPPMPDQEITATGFARSFIIVYRHLFRPTNRMDGEPVNGLRYFIDKKTMRVEITDVFERHLYQRSHTLADWLSRQTQRIQNGNINLYLFYIFVLVIGLMAWVRWG